MDTDLAATPTLAAVRLARTQRDAVIRRLRSVGLISLAIVLVIGSRQQPRPGLHGAPLAVLLALLAVEIGGVAALWLPREAGRRLVLPIAVLAAGSIVLDWLQPRGTAGSLGFLVVALAAMRALPARRGRLMVAAGVAGTGLILVLAAATLHAHGHAPSAASVLAAILPGFAVAVVVLTRRLDRDSYQIERLLMDLDRAQDAEVRAAALAERQRLAREMHDVLAHSLSGLTLQLEGARLLAAEDSADPRLADAIERAHHLARSGLQEARRAIGMLRDDELPGPERLAGLAAEFERDSGLPCKFAVTGTPHPLDPQVRLALYRVAQEALTNILKHAHACRAEVRLCYQPRSTHLAVEDFGSGRPAQVAESPGYGLTGMRERAELLGGRLTTAPTRTGFLVELWVPA
ncbi:MAG TPA: sensor histidine kinase [Streptosporangiaceae bacterium]|jgi:signal transduction histidine kinase